MTESDAIARRLAAIVETSDDAIVSKDLNGIVLSWNQAAERMFGYTAEEMVGKSIRLIIPAERQSEEDTVLAAIRAGRRVEHFETVRRARDGRLVPISLTVSPVLDANGTVIGASKIARDISDRKNAEQQAEKASQRDAFLAEATVMLTSSVDYEETLRSLCRLAVPYLARLLRLRCDQPGRRPHTCGCGTRASGQDLSRRRPADALRRSGRGDQPHEVDSYENAGRHPSTSPTR